MNSQEDPYKGRIIDSRSDPRTHPSDVVYGIIIKSQPCAQSKRASGPCWQIWGRECLKHYATVLITKGTKHHNVFDVVYGLCVLKRRLKNERRCKKAVYVRPT